MRSRAGITDAEILAGWRAPFGHEMAPPEILGRRRFRQTTGLTGSHFERVRLRCGGQRLDGILKLSTLRSGPPTRERLFFAELARDVPVRVPRCLAVGPAIEGRDGWVLMERVRGAKRLVDWSLDDTRTAIRVLAGLHARFLGAPPAGLPRPFTRDLEHTLSFIGDGVRAIQARYQELPHLPRVAGARALEIAGELTRRPEALRAPFARSPETLLHGDYHRGNLAARDGEEPVVLDWQFVCAGPPAYDLAVFWLYLGAVNKPGLFGIDRAAVQERSLGWDRVVSVYRDALRALVPEADVEAIVSCADAAIVCEALREIIYLGSGLETFIGLLRFAYRDHPTVGGWLARYLGLDQGWSMLAEVFRELEWRGARLVAG